MRILLVALALGGIAAMTGLPKGSHDVVRLQAHFDSVDSGLRHAAPSGLDPKQLESRAQLIEWLRDYRNAGSFPSNDRFADAMPFFRDSRGVLCAMAYLIARSGRVDLVDRIALTRNNAFIPELAGEAELTRWLDSVGLSATEAARIQPSYGGESGTKVSTSFAVGSIILGGGALVASGFNIFSPTRTSGWLGLAAGVGAGILGATHFTDTGDVENELLALGDMVIGVTAMALGIRGIIVGGREETATAAGGGRGKRVEVGLAPFIRPSGAQPGFGLVMQARF